MDLFLGAQTKEKRILWNTYTSWLPALNQMFNLDFFRSNISMIDDYRDNWWCAFSELKKSKKLSFQDILFFIQPTYFYF